MVNLKARVRGRHRSPTVESLSRLPLFADCHRVYLNELARHSEEITLEAGAVLDSRALGSGALLVVLSGQARVTCEGREVTSLEPGDLVTPATAPPCPGEQTVVAAEPLVLLRIDLIGA